MDWLRLFAFTLDGEADNYSINPLEMTNYERFAWLSAFAVVIVALALEWWKHRRLSGLDRSAEKIYVAAPLGAETESDKTAGG